MPGERILDRMVALCGSLSKAALAIMTLIVLSQVVTRYFLGFSFRWSEEVARYLMIWMVFLSASVVQRRDGHIRVDYFAAMMSPGVTRAFSILSRAAIIGYLGVLIVQGWTTAVFMETTRFASIDVSMFWAYLALPVGGCLMALFECVNLIGDIRSPVRRAGD